MTVLKSNVEALAKLEEEFGADDIEFRVGSTSKDKSKGMALPYITNRAIMQRLDQSVGKGYWRNEYQAWHNGSQLCGISVKVIYEDGTSEWITKWDGAECSDFEPIKGGLSDSMKRAAVHWGIGRYLYEMDAIWVELKDGKYIPDSEKERLKRFIQGDKNARYNNSNSGSSSTGSQGSSNGNTNSDIASDKQKAILKKNMAQLGLTEGDIETMPKSKAKVLIDKVFNSGSSASNDNSSKGGNTSSESANAVITPNVEGANSEYCSAGQVKFILDLAPKAGKNEADIITYYKVESLDKLSKSQAKQCIDLLRKKAS
jgi:hypothetical protein